MTYVDLVFPVTAWDSVLGSASGIGEGGLEPALGGTGLKFSGSKPNLTGLPKGFDNSSSSS